MRVRSGGLVPRGKLWAHPESDEDLALLKTYCLGRAVPLKNDGVGIWDFTVNDNLVNRIVLNLPLEIIHPVYTRSQVQLPPGYSLRDYQAKDLEKLGNLRQALNANIPGYGKTLEALIWAHRIGAERILILCPKSTKYQWQYMCQFWGMFTDVEVSPASGILTSKASVITNYEQLYDGKRLEQIKGVAWDAVILDEIHKIRNPDRFRKPKSGYGRGRPSKTITGIAHELPGLFRMGLTGSPIYNRPDDLYSICNWLNPKYVGESYWDFVNLFCKVKEDFWGRKPVGLSEDPVKVDLLKRVLDCFMVRNPENLLGIESQEITIPIELSKEQRRLYKMIKKLAIEELQQEGITLANGMAQLIKLQQVTSNPELFELEGNPKFEWIFDFLESNPGEKVVVFSIYRKTILAFNEACQKAVGPVATIHGGVSEWEREAQKQDFLRQSDVRVLSGTIGAMGESIDGLQKACRTVIFLDRDWAPESNNQAKRRVLRMGQQSFVHIYMLEGIDTIDKKVGKVLMEKVSDVLEVLDVC